MTREGFLTATALTAALFIGDFFNLPHRDWILATIGIIYLAGSVTGLKFEKINKRIFGSLIGLIIGLLLMRCFGYYEYRILYLVPLTWFFMFYFSFIFDNYTYIAVFVSILTLFSTAILSKEYSDWNIYNTITSRMICTVIGGVILIITEIIFFYHESRADKKIYPELKALVQILGSLANEIIILFENNEKTSEEYKKKYFKLFDEVYNLHLLLRAASFEITFNKEKMQLYRTLCDELYTAMDHMREAMFININKFQIETINQKLFEEIRVYFEQEFNNGTSSKGLGEIVTQHKRDIFSAGRANTEYYFLQALFKLNVQLQKINETSKLIEIK